MRSMGVGQEALRRDLVVHLCRLVADRCCEIDGMTGQVMPRIFPVATTYFNQRCVC